MTENPMRWASLVGSCMVVAGCASTSPPAPAPADPPQDPAPPPTVVLPPEPTAYELGQRERAATLARQGRLAEAALVWEVLATIRPSVAEYRERRAELQQQIDAGVADRLQKGDQAASRGQIDTAMQQYLAALALQPENARAADALRAAERERVKRNHLGKLSRNTLTRRAQAEGEVGPNDAPMDAVAMGSQMPAGGKSSSADERNETERATLLVSQGEFDAAITMLERRLKTNRRDDEAREVLADAYFQKAEVTAPRNRNAAIALLERSLRNDPKHPRAPERLRQLRAAAAAAAAQPVVASSPAPAGTAPAAAPSSLKPTGGTLVSPASSPPATPRR